MRRGGETYVSLFEVVGRLEYGVFLASYAVGQVG